MGEINKEYEKEYNDMSVLKLGVESILSNKAKASNEEKLKAIDTYNTALKKYKSKWGSEGDDFDFINSNINLKKEEKPLYLYKIAIYKMADDFIKSSSLNITSSQLVQQYLDKITQRKRKEKMLKIKHYKLKGQQ